MYKISCLLILIFSVSGFAQTKRDSLSGAELKAELKQEIKQELIKEMAKTSLEEGKEAKKEAEDKNRLISWNKFSLEGYGVINYFNNDYDTDPAFKDKFDTERLNLYLGYQFTKNISFLSEFEFEHGGTGIAMEYDTQEESGEFEQEVEQGGEVKLEQAYINFKIAPYFNIIAGRMKLHFGLAQDLDEPTEYFTTTLPEMQNALLPLGWYENGIEFYGEFAKHFHYRAYIVSGLDATGFSSQNWIKFGHQGRFEMINAESLAFAARLDYQFGTSDKTYFGISGYVNDAAANRPKDDMQESAYVTIGEAHFSYHENNLRIHSQVLYGNLENSNIVSLKNSKLSNNLNVKRNPVGKNAFGFSTEIGYDILSLITPDSHQKLFPFGRYDYYDTFQEVEGNVIKNPRWQRSTITAGINWFVIDDIVVKAQYTDRCLGSENYDQNTLEFTGKKQHERTFSLGLAFEF